MVPGCVDEDRGVDDRARKQVFVRDPGRLLQSGIEVSNLILRREKQRLHKR